MRTFKINSPVTIFDHPEYGQRLIFNKGIVNPRDELGKNGVTFHNSWGRYFYNTIAIEAELISEDGSRQPHIFNINRNSLIKHVGVQTPISDPDLIAELMEAMELGSVDRIKAGENGLRHAGRYNQQTLSQSWFGNLWKKFISWFYQATIGSLQGIKARFLVVGTEKSLLETGEQLAGYRYQQALTTTPAYQAHLTMNGTVVDPKMLRDIPETSKANYIKPQTHDANLHIGGVYPYPYKVDTSTGTTGKPTAWVRSAKEVETVKKSLQLASKIQFGNRRLSYIDAFALGPWATGLTTYELMRGTGGILATGPDKEKIFDEMYRVKREENHQIEQAITRLDLPKDVIADLRMLLTACLRDLVRDKTLSPQEALSKQLTQIKSASSGEILKQQTRVLKELEKLNELKTQIIIAGYPPFLNDLRKYVEQKGYRFDDFDVIGVVGGQAISEAMRDLLIRDGYQQIYSSYGASDLDINLGVETEFEITVRKTIEQNPDLAKELYGENKGLPMVFHYDPLNYHVECSDQNDLIYTCTRNDRSSERIRYNLGDKGRVYASSDVQALLAKYGVFATPKTNLPLMFVWGRESTVVYNGANLAFTELERAITNCDPESLILKKAFRIYHDADGAERTELLLELNDDVTLDHEQQKQMAIKIIRELAEINQDFRWQLEQLDPNDLFMNVRFYNRGYSPISEAGGHRKQVLVFNEHNLPADFEFVEDENSTLIQVKNNQDYHAQLEQQEVTLTI